MCETAARSRYALPRYPNLQRNNRERTAMIFCYQAGIYFHIFAITHWRLFSNLYLALIPLASSRKHTGVFFPTFWRLILASSLSDAVTSQ